MFNALPDICCENVFSFCFQACKSLLLVAYIGGCYVRPILQYVPLKYCEYREFMATVCISLYDSGHPSPIHGIVYDVSIYFAISLVIVED